MNNIFGLFLFALSIVCHGQTNTECYWVPKFLNYGKIISKSSIDSIERVELRKLCSDNPLSTGANWYYSDSIYNNLIVQVSYLNKCDSLLYLFYSNKINDSVRSLLKKCEKWKIELLFIDGDSIKKSYSGHINFLEHDEFCTRSAHWKFNKQNDDFKWTITKNEIRNSDSIVYFSERCNHHFEVEALKMVYSVDGVTYTSFISPILTSQTKDILLSLKSNSTVMFEPKVISNGKTIKVAAYAIKIID